MDDVVHCINNLKISLYAEGNVYYIGNKDPSILNSEMTLGEQQPNITHGAMLIDLLEEKLLF